MLCGNGVKLGV